MIRASGLLRLLLLDAPNLLSQAHPGAKVRFQVLGPLLSIYPEVDFPDRKGNNQLISLNFVPRVEGLTIARSLPLNAFLAFPIAYSGSAGRLSVRLIIRAGAIAFGGVHFQTPRAEEEQYIEDVLRDWEDDDIASPLGGLLGQIAEVTVRALLPLAAEDPSPSVGV